MKKVNGYRIWQVVYPIGMYYVVSSVAYFLLELIFGGRTETYMLRQLVCAAVTVPFVLQFYMQDRKAEETVFGKKKFQIGTEEFQNILFSIVSAATLGLAVNNIIAMTPLIKQSAGFQEANQAFFGGQVVFELLGSCLLIPVAEELLFRGVVYKRLKIMSGVLPALFISALIFGLVHMNAVQFLYAGILGLLLAFLLEKTGCLYAPILGHIAANVVAVVRQETGWLAFSYQPTEKGIGFTLLILLIALAVIGYMVKTYQDSE